MNSSGVEYHPDEPAASAARRPSGRPPGASRTRDDILAAAGRQFAEHGYDRASLRAIAADAGVDARLIAHYFGSKQGLFLETVGLPLNPAEILLGVLAAGREGARERIAATLRAILSESDLHERLTAVIRAAASEPDVARLLREFLSRELFEPAARALPGGDGALRANLAGSQVVGLVMTRYVIGVEPLALAAPDAIARAIAPTIERYLFGSLEN